MSAPRRYREFVGDLRHFASIRRATFEDGPEKGLSVLLINAGPLSLTVLAGRAMDIGTLTLHGIPIGWTGPSGFVSPAHVNMDAEGGRGFARGLTGFLMTGGLTHIRQPVGDEPLHGRLPFTPARIIGAKEDWSAEQIWCEGEVRQSRHGRENLLLRRRIELPISGSGLTITDVVVNEGAESISPELLYHFNLGFPAVANGTSVFLNGDEVISQIEMPDRGEPQTPLVLEVGQFLAACNTQTQIGSRRFGMALKFSTDTLPCLQLWRDMRPRAGILSIEPCTSIPGERSALLEPGQHRRYRVSIQFTGSTMPH